MQTYCGGGGDRGGELRGARVEEGWKGLGFAFSTVLYHRMQYMMIGY